MRVTAAWQGLSQSPAWRSPLTGSAHDLVGAVLSNLELRDDSATVVPPDALGRVPHVSTWTDSLMSSESKREVMSSEWASS